MSNMSYCRFENTANDLQDCADHLRGKLSESETQARECLVMLCAKILQDVGYDISDPTQAELDGLNERDEDEDDDE